MYAILALILAPYAYNGYYKPELYQETAFVLGLTAAGLLAVAIARGTKSLFKLYKKGRTSQQATPA